MATRKQRLSISYVPVLVLLLVLNMLILDGIILWRINREGSVLGITSSDTCPSACIARINQIAGKTSSPSNVKEYYVPLGSGTNASDDWTDVSGASAYVDTAAYGKMKKVTFEATISQPVSSQQVWVRLYNATDKHPVWYSEVSTDNSGPLLLTSSPLSLDSGNKLYQVQMKTQLRGVTNLTQSRIHIITY